MINTIAQLVKSGEVKREKITAAYNRIINFKKAMLVENNSQTQFNADESNYIKDQVHQGV